MESKIIELKKNGDDRGQLIVVEGAKSIPFEIKRLFYIYGCDEGAVRGQHANINSSFVFAVVKGSCNVKVIENDGSEAVFELDDPAKLLYVPKMSWKEMSGFSKDCVLLVIADTHYDPDEYIRSLDDFMGKIKHE